MLLLAAASSSFQAGPGLLKALARTGPGGEHGLLPPRFARTNRHHTPVAAVVVYAVISAAIILAASGQEQELVLVYAVSVFVSFLAGLLAMARFSHRDGKRLLTATNVVGRGRGRVHADREPRARLPADRDRRHDPGRRIPSLALGAGRPPAWDPSDRA